MFGECTAGETNKQKQTETKIKILCSLENFQRKILMLTAAA